jgi:hypothetical protein
MKKLRNDTLNLGKGILETKMSKIATADFGFRIADCGFATVGGGLREKGRWPRTVA